MTSICLKANVCGALHLDAGARAGTLQDTAGRENVDSREY